MARRRLRALLEADVEPDRRVEGGELVDEDRLQLGLEGLGLLVVLEVTASRPQAPIVSTTRPIICLTLDSRSGEDMRPRKYFCATMFVAVCDQNFGNSTPFCSKTEAVLAGDEGVAELPVDLVEGVAPGDGEVALDAAGPRASTTLFEAPQPR